MIINDVDHQLQVSAFIQFYYFVSIEPYKWFDKKKEKYLYDF